MVRINHLNPIYITIQNIECISKKKIREWKIYSRGMRISDPVLELNGSRLTIQTRVHDITGRVTKDGRVSHPVHKLYKKHACAAEEPDGWVDGRTDRRSPASDEIVGISYIARESSHSVYLCIIHAYA